MRQFRQHFLEPLFRALNRAKPYPAVHPQTSLSSPQPRTVTTSPKPTISTLPTNKPVTPPTP